MLLLISSDCASHAGSRAPACTCPGMRICSCSSGCFFCLILTKKTKKRNDIIPRPHRLYLPRDPPDTIYILYLECNVPARALRRADREDQPPPLFPPHALENVLGMPTWILWARCREPPRRKMLYACVSNPNPARQYRRLAVSCTRMPVPWSYIQTVIPDPGV